MALLDPEELEAKGLADYPPPTELPRELADRVDYLAPHPPQALREDDWPRWALKRSARGAERDRPIRRRDGYRAAEARVERGEGVVERPGHIPDGRSGDGLR